MSAPESDRPAGGFFSRWSRRKADVREAEAAAVVPVAPPAPVPANTPPAGASATEPTDPAQPPAPTLADVAELQVGDEVSRFVQRDVNPDVRNAALKKLFADPHYNVMDGLDIYIDDYSQPDPLPEGWLERMVQSEALGLFRKDPTEPEAGDADLVTAAAPDTAPALEADRSETLTLPEPTPDENADLRLQPDPAAERPRAEPGPGEDTGR
ncbi:DUF3306 domain-containing protein [Ideonella margarita]|uniref:DUF3306 domain-containing protein n=1 Tax=Ideonella margarita TaxID=2984191 RepID=A0ABU9C4X0_9BURK